MPYAEQARLVARSVVNRALSDAGVPGIKRPGRDVIVALAPLSAREIYQTVTAAVATAVKRRQRFIGLEHLPPELVAEDGAEEGGGTPRARLREAIKLPPRQGTVIISILDQFEEHYRPQATWFDTADGTWRGEQRLLQAKRIPR